MCCSSWFSPIQRAPNWSSTCSFYSSYNSLVEKYRCYCVWGGWGRGRESGTCTESHTQSKVRSWIAHKYKPVRSDFTQWQHVTCIPLLSRYPSRTASWLWELAPVTKSLHFLQSHMVLIHGAVNTVILCRNPSPRPTACSPYFGFKWVVSHFKTEMGGIKIT